MNLKEVTLAAHRCLLLCKLLRELTWIPNDITWDIQTAKDATTLPPWPRNLLDCLPSELRKWDCSLLQSFSLFFVSIQMPLIKYLIACLHNVGLTLGAQSAFLPPEMRHNCLTKLTYSFLFFESTFTKSGDSKTRKGGESRGVLLLAHWKVRERGPWGQDQGFCCARFLCLQAPWGPPLFKKKKYVPQRRAQAHSKEDARTDLFFRLRLFILSLFLLQGWFLETPRMVQCLTYWWRLFYNIASNKRRVSQPSDNRIVYL